VRRVDLIVRETFNRPPTFVNLPHVTRLSDVRSQSVTLSIIYIIHCVSHPKLGWLCESSISHLDVAPMQLPYGSLFFTACSSTTINCKTIANTTFNTLHHSQPACLARFLFFHTLHDDACCLSCSNTNLLTVPFACTTLGARS